MARRYVFVLNLDADLELGRARYTPTASVAAAVRANASRLLGTLVGPNDAVADDTTPDATFLGWEGRAFAPTPRAIATLRRVGATLPESPDVTVLERVMRRDFAYAHELPASLVTKDAELAIAHVASPPPLGDGFRVKRARGMAGRGHRVVRGVPTSADIAFLRASTEGVVIEPNVRIVFELSIHGYLARDGRLVAGRACRSRVAPSGAFLEAEPCDAETRARWEPRLLESLVDVSESLRREGYFGPFGVDAFVYGDAGSERLRARSEVNARYSMGWAIGMLAAGERPDLDRAMASYPAGR